MSLLMDALKRAEHAKQEAARNQPGKSPTPDGEHLALEPLTPPTTGSAPASPLPDLASRINAVDADLASSQRVNLAGGQPRANTVADTQRDAVRNAFAAKAAAPSPTSGKPVVYLLGGLVLAGLAIGAYVWVQLNNLGQSGLATPAPSSAQPPVALEKPVPAAVPAVPVNSEFTPNFRSTAEASTPAPMPAPMAAIAASRVTSPRPVAAPPLPADNMTAPGIRLTKSHPQLDSGLTQAHASFQRGETTRARIEFEQSLQRDPNNTDALLALSAIAQRQGRQEEANALLHRAVVANPGDPAVQAAVLSGKVAEIDPQSTESRLKSLLANDPESAPLNFALGNLYARQQRWAEAQQTYFNAVAAEEDNPDYLFNLAVSLDHLRQPRLAAQHYRLALEAAAKQPAAFDRTSVARRLDELQASAR